MHKAIVILGVLGAGGAAWAMETYVYEGWSPPATVRLKTFRRSLAAPPADAPAAVPAAIDPKSGKPTDAAAKPGVKPAATPAVPAKPEPPKGPPPVVRKVTDVKLVVAKSAQDFTLKMFREVHVDNEGTMARHSEGGKIYPYDGYKQLGLDLREKSDAFVIVPTPETPWLQIRTMLLEGQFNYAWNAFLGVAKAGEPDVLRLLPVQQAERPDDPMPEGKVFKVQMTSKDGPVALVVNDKKLTEFPSDLAAAWNEWSKANPDAADTSTPLKTHVVFEAPKGAPIRRVIEVIDVLRGIGITTERIGGEIPTRPRK
ncbi:MAG: hypothetical protein K8T90_09015 [Planctomycetes bacterium]|nr:hypothetical protein [Planctomycetota bacterium]